MLREAKTAGRSSVSAQCPGTRPNERFEAVWPALERLGFDQRFRRMWTFYLAYCEAGFLEKTVDVGIYRLRQPL